MKNNKFLSKLTMTAILLTALMVASANRIFTQDAGRDSRPNPTGDGVSPAAAAGYVSGVFSLLPGQSVRVSAVNAGDKEIPLELVIVPVDEQGKAGIPIKCNATPAPGDAAIEKYTIPDGTSNRRLMYVQIRVEDDADLQDIAPSLEVFSEQPGAGGPHFVLSGDDFIAIRPIWVPS